MAIFQAVWACCDHQDPSGKPDCAAKELAALVASKPGEAPGLVFPDVKQKDIETGHTWAQKTDTIIVDGQAPRVVLLCPLHSPKPQAAPAPKVEAPKPAPQAPPTRTFNRRG
jgi:hypothetical protein